MCKRNFQYNDPTLCHWFQYIYIYISVLVIYYIQFKTAMYVAAKEFFSP